MTTPIARALILGFAAPQILDFVTRAFPSLVPRVKKAKSAGYSVQQILNILNQGMGGKADENLTESQIHQQRNEQQNQSGKDLLKVAGGAAAGLAAKQFLPGIVQGAQNLLGGQQNPPTGIPPASPTAIGPHPMANAPVQPPSTNQANPAIAAGAIQTPEQSQPVAPTQQPLSPQKQRATAFIQKLGVEEKVKELARKGKTPEQIASDIQIDLHPSTRKAYLAKRARGEEIPIAQHVKEYLTNGEGLLREDVVKFGQPTNVKPEKNLVATPQGLVGTIKSERDKEALVEADGKLHKVKKEDLIESPLPEKDLADLYNDVLRGTEEETGEEVSRNVNWAGYDPKTNTLAYLPHLGAFYTYEDIDPEESKLLTSILNTRKTSGENFIGAWREGSKSPIGAAMSALIKKLQAAAGGKGKEYSHKFETLYSALEPAMRAAKKKKAEEDKRKRMGAR